MARGVLLYIIEPLIPIVIQILSPIALEGFVSQSQRPERKAPKHNCVRYHWPLRFSVAPTGAFLDGGASRESPVLKPFRRIAPNVESDAASAPACWIRDIRRDVNPRPV